MTPLLASSIALLLYSAVVVPLLLAVTNLWAGRAALALLGAGLTGLVLQQGGWLEHRSLAPFDIRDIESAALSEGGQCAQVLRLLTDARIIIDRSDPVRIVVSGQLWPQLPAAVRDATMACVEEGRSGDGAQQPIEVVLR